MFELLKAGGILMVPIVACSILALAIILERIWTLRASRVAPPQSINELWRWIKKKELNGRKLKALQASSPLGRILAGGLINAALQVLKAEGAEQITLVARRDAGYWALLATDSTPDDQPPQAMVLYEVRQPAAAERPSLCSLMEGWDMPMLEMLDSSSALGQAHAAAHLRIARRPGEPIVEFVAVGAEGRGDPDQRFFCQAHPV